MNKRRRLIIAASIPAAILLILILAVLFVPDQALRSLVTRGLDNAGYTFKAAHFGKALPLGIKARNLEIGDDRGPLFRADQVSLRLQLFPLLIGKIQFALHAGIGAGVVSGDFSLQKGGSGRLTMSGIRLEEIPFFSTATGAQAKGIMRINANITGLRNLSITTGEAQLEIKGAELAGVKIGGTPLPDAAYHTVQGMLRVKSGKATLESLTLQGDNFYARLKGDVPLISPLAAAPLNLALELMPQPEFLEKQKFVFLLLIKYLVTPGHYQLPIRGTLGKPTML